MVLGIAVGVEFEVAQPVPVGVDVPLHDGVLGCTQPVNAGRDLHLVDREVTRALTSRSVVRLVGLEFDPAVLLPKQPYQYRVAPPVEPVVD